MGGITINEIIEKLTIAGLNMGKNPHATFYFYKRKFSLPDPIGVRDKEAIYPVSIIGEIKKIKEFQKEGLTLEQIAERFNEMEKEKFIDETYYRTGWHTKHEAQGRLLKILNLVNVIDNLFDYCIGYRYQGFRHEYKCVIVVRAENFSNIIYYLIRIDHPEMEGVVETRTFSGQDYERFIGNLASKRMFSNNMHLIPTDVYKAVFSDVTISKTQTIN